MAAGTPRHRLLFGGLSRKRIHMKMTRYAKAKWRRSETLPTDLQATTRPLTKSCQLLPRPIDDPKVSKAVRKISLCHLAHCFQRCFICESGLSPKNKPNCGFQRLFDTTNKGEVWQREENENSGFFCIFYNFFSNRRK